jgi:hypothetical protein
MLETDDEYFSYSPDQVSPHGRWTISGLDLSRGTLEKVYAKNSLAIFGGDH